MSDKIRNIPLIWIIIAVFVVKEAAWLAVIPPREAPDELGHYAYIETMYYEQKLPQIGQTYFSLRAQSAGTADSVDSSAYRTGNSLNWIAQHPPAYYLLLLPLYSVLPHDNVLFSIFLMRFVSILLGVATLYYVFKTLQKLLPGRDMLSSAVVCAMAFLPTFSFMNAVLNNDNLLLALSSYLFYLLAVQPVAGTPAGGAPDAGTTAVAQSASLRWSVKTGVVLALLALTKVSALPIFITVFIIQVYHFFRAKKGEARRRQAVTAFMVFGLPLLLAAWWYVRNFFIFHTFFPELGNAVAVNPQLLNVDPEVFKSFPEAVPRAVTEMGFADFLFGKGFLLSYFKNVWGASYGIFPNLTPFQYGMIYAFTILGAGGWLVAAFKAYKDKKLKPRKILFSDEMVSLLIVVLFLAAISWKVYAVTLDRGYLGAMHGRYFFPALPSFFYLLLKGWGHIIPEKRQGAACVVFMALFVLNDAGTLLYVVQGFNLPA